MFKHLKNIDTAFRHVRSFSLLLIVACIATSSYAIYAAHHVVSRAEQKMCVLANGKAFEAIASDRKDNIPVEARDHVRTFHQLFFSLDPDDKVIQDNISKALYLADGSAKTVYESLKENNYYTGIISGNVSQQIDVDSVFVNINQYPYHHCIVVVLDKFTIPDAKYLTIEIGEKNGGRNLLMKVNNRKIIKALPLSDFK